MLLEEGSGRAFPSVEKARHSFQTGRRVDCAQWFEVGVSVSGRDRGSPRVQGKCLDQDAERGIVDEWEVNGEHSRRIVFTIGGILERCFDPAEWAAGRPAILNHDPPARRRIGAGRHHDDLVGVPPQRIGGAVDEAPSVEWLHRLVPTEAAARAAREDRTHEPQLLHTTRSGTE